MIPLARPPAPKGGEQTETERAAYQEMLDGDVARLLRCKRREFSMLIGRLIILVAGYAAVMF